MVMTAAAAGADDDLSYALRTPPRRMRWSAGPVLALALGVGTGGAALALLGLR